MTSPIVDWLPLFVLPSCCDILAQALDFCRREKGLRLYAWVIMDMIKKIDTLHANPVRRGRAVSPEHWRYSSAHESLSGAVPVLRCDEWR